MTDYHITFRISNDNAPAFIGSATVSIEGPMTSDRLHEHRRKLSKYMGVEDRMIILGWQRFEA